MILREDNLLHTKVGKLFIMERLPNRQIYGEPRIVYLCKCDCGEVFERTRKDILSSIKSGLNISCGNQTKHPHKIVLNNSVAKSHIGEKHGKLKIINIISAPKETSRRGYDMVCECDCGEITNKRYSELLNGKVSSCGCYRKETTSITGSRCGINNRTHRRGNCNWYVIKNGEQIRMRSSFEVMYAIALSNKNIKWEYEPQCFKLQDGMRYTPDFYLPETNEYIEVKGYLDERQNNKYNVFKCNGNKLSLVYIKQIEDELGYSFYKFKTDWKNNKINNITN